MDANRYRLIGLILAFGPINWILSYAITAIAIGEDRLEGPDAVPFLGAAVMLAPHLIGVAVLLGSSRLQERWPLTDRRMFAVAAGLGCLLIAGGLFATVASARDGDANIGGSLLVMVGLWLSLAGGIGLFVLSRRAAR